MRVFCSFVLVCVIGVQGKVAPDGFPACKRTDPQIEKCFLDGIENIRPQLQAGIPEVNIPSLEPFLVPTLKLDRTAPNLRLKAVLKNMVARGGGNFRIDRLKINLNNKYAAEVKLFIPRLAVTVDYDVKGSRLLVLDIDGKGQLRGNFTGIQVVAKGSAKVIEKDGESYLQADKIATRLKINHGQIDINDTERPYAANSAVAFFNSSPNVVLDILNPLIEDTGAAIMKAFLNKIFGSIPLKELILD